MANCKVCGVDKVRNHNPSIGNDYRYEDENGRPWNGRQCPQCAYDVKPKAMGAKKIAKFLRAPQRADRVCSKCKKQLPPDLYFTHRECRGLNWADYDDTEPYKVAL